MSKKITLKAIKQTLEEVKFDHGITLDSSRAPIHILKCRGHEVARFYSDDGALWMNCSTRPKLELLTRFLEELHYWMGIEQ